LGYGVEMEKVELDVFGMTCATCSTRIEKMLNKQEGVGRATVNLANETAVIEYSPGVLTDTELTDKIKAFGYDDKRRSRNEEKQTHNNKLLMCMNRQLFLSIILSLPHEKTMLVQLFRIKLPAAFMTPSLQMLLAAPIHSIIRWQFYKGAYTSIRS